MAVSGFETVSTNSFYSNTRWFPKSEPVPSVKLAVRLLSTLYSRWMNRWEANLANADTDRVVRPFDWGLDWLGLDAGEDPGGALNRFAAQSVLESEHFFAATPRPAFRLDGATLSFESQVQSPHQENNTVYAEYFPSPESRGRAVLVIPQWNSDEQSHIGLCRLLNRAGLSALRMSKAYHHRRKPPHLNRADYHVSSNLGRTIQATRQSAIDARSCLDWLESRGYSRLGVLGSSLGSCVALLTVAHDPRPRAAVFNHVSAWFGDVVWTGVSCRHIRQALEGHVTQEGLRRYWAPISPASYMDRLAGRDLRTLLIWADRDTTFLPEYSQLALRGFRERRIPHSEVRLPCGHYTLGKFPFNWLDGIAMTRFLRRSL